MTIITNWNNTVADVRLISEIRITIRNLGGGSDDDSGPAESVVRKDGPFDRWGFSSRFAAARSATISGPIRLWRGGADANSIFPSDVLASTSQDG